MLVLTAVKSILSFSVSVGAGASVKLLVSAVTPETVSPLTKFALKASSVVIGVAVADLTSRYLEDQIDHMVEIGKALKTGAQAGRAFVEEVKKQEEPKSTDGL